MIKNTKIFCISIIKDNIVLEKSLWLADQDVDYKIISQISKFLIEHNIKTIKIRRSQIDYFCHSNNSLEIVVHWCDGQLGAKT